MISKAREKCVTYKSKIKYFSKKYIFYDCNLQHYNVAAMFCALW